MPMLPPARRRRRRWRRREGETAAVERAGQPAFAFGRACGSVGGRGAGAGGGGRPCHGAVGRFQVHVTMKTVGRRIQEAQYDQYCH
uniref:Uncharacterized protein n=1 Tax=Oryza meridionalis TaxID=40149 RepID=A0A0E0CBP8_9ORYZ